MFQSYFAASDLLVWPLVGLVIFFTVFVGVLVWVFFGARDRGALDRVASLPLEPDAPNEAAGGGKS